MARIAAFGEPVTNTAVRSNNNPNAPEQVNIEQMFKDLINSFVRYNITKMKYEQAVKMAKPACEEDPANCPYYIRQALIALGINPDQVMGQGYGTQTVGTPKYQIGSAGYIPTNQSNKDDTEWILITVGIAALTGLAVWYFTKERG